MEVKLMLTSQQTTIFIDLQAQQISDQQQIIADLQQLLQLEQGRRLALVAQLRSIQLRLQLNPVYAPTLILQLKELIAEFE
jgi:hypothetical protein